MELVTNDGFEVVGGFGGIVGELPERCAHHASFLFYSLVYGDVISKHFLLCIFGFLVCYCEGRSTG